MDSEIIKTPEDYNHDAPRFDIEDIREVTALIAERMGGEAVESAYQSAQDILREVLFVFRPDLFRDTEEAREDAIIAAYNEVPKTARGFRLGCRVNFSKPTGERCIGKLISIGNVCCSVLCGGISWTMSINSISGYQRDFDAIIFPGEQDEWLEYERIIERRIRVAKGLPADIAETSTDQKIDG